MSFVGEALFALGSAAASFFSSAGTAAASLFSFSSASAASAAGAATTGAATTGATAAGASSSFLGLSTGFWKALGTTFTALATIGSTISSISANRQMANLALIDTGIQREAAQLDYDRRLSDIRRETERETARRTSLLSATGGLVDGADMVLEGLLEGARAQSRLATDLGFEMGALVNRAASIRAGSRRSNTGELFEGSARLASLLLRQ